MKQIKKANDFVPEKTIPAHIVGTKGTTYIPAKTALGFCHSKLHPGIVTRSVLKSHGCLEKGCPSLQKYDDRPYWESLNGFKSHREKERHHVRQKKKEAKKKVQAIEQENYERLEQFQKYADEFGADIEFVSVEQPKSRVFVALYVSPRPYNDWDELYELREYITANLERSYIRFQHVIGPDGQYVTTEEYRKRKK